MTSPIGSPLANPFTLAIKITWAIMGVLMIIGGLIPAWEPLLVLEHVPKPLSMAIGAFVLVGSVLCLVGIYRRGPSVDPDWWLERIGLVLLTAAWLCCTVSAITSHPEALASWTIFGGFSVASILRYRAVLREARETVARIREWEGRRHVD